MFGYDLDWLFSFNDIRLGAGSDLGNWWFTTGS